PQVTQPLLEVQDLHTVFSTKEGWVKAVDGVSFELHPGETLGIVGESGCGKSVTALSIMRLQRPGLIKSGRVMFKGEDLTKATEAEMREVRGREIAMIFQDPILDLLRHVNQEFGTATILITHNLGVVAGMCKRIIVMYAGRIVEAGPTTDVFAHPKHPYTWALLRSIPRLDAERHEPLKPIEGLPPNLVDLPGGCAFHPRCAFKIEKCSRDVPALQRVGDTQLSACWVTQAGTELKGA